MQDKQHPDKPHSVSNRRGRGGRPHQHRGRPVKHFQVVTEGDEAAPLHQELPVQQETHSFHPSPPQQEYHQPFHPPQRQINVPQQDTFHSYNEPQFVDSPENLLLQQANVQRKKDFRNRRGGRVGSPADAQFVGREFQQNSRRHKEQPVQQKTNHSDRPRMEQTNETQHSLQNLGKQGNKKKKKPQKFSQQYAGAFSSFHTPKRAEEEQQPTTPKNRVSSSIVFNSKKDQMIDELTKCTYECLICMEKIKRHVAVWSCDRCYHVYHLFCVRKWAKQAPDTSSLQSPSIASWKCPACQHEQKSAPNKYSCFCGKMVEPEDDLALTPHSCGDICGKRRADTKCAHPCNELCHPGPCPPCNSFRTDNCFCGKQTYQVICSEAVQQQSCGKICNHVLNCKVHTCQDQCHSGDCKPCPNMTTQRCYCGKQQEERPCVGPINLDQDSIPHSYSCKKVCGKKLSCGNHNCTRLCHNGDCESCPTSLKIDHCPCGKTLLRILAPNNPRTSCLDPILRCDKICGKLLPCGTHTCTQICHNGPCGHCTKLIPISCRCKASHMQLPCLYQYFESFKKDDSQDETLKQQGEELFQSLKQKYKTEIPFTCQRVCNAKKSCGKHKCERKCCPANREHDIYGAHICQAVCNKMLNCGQHRCEFPCHLTKCPPCAHVVREPIACTCGKTVLRPPQVCGTKAPECFHSCSIRRECGHSSNHTCHQKHIKCPVCMVPVIKKCSGGHGREVRNIACCMKEVSCGADCGKLLSCKKHICTKPCHAGSCQKPSEQREQKVIDGESEQSQPFTCGKACEEMLSCGHKCKQICHPLEPCNETLCAEKTRVFCPCKRISEFISCGTLRKQFAHSHPNELFVINALPAMLKCNMECKILERNKRLAAALEINADKLSLPMFPSSLQLMGKRDMGFVEQIEEEFERFLNSPLAKEHLFKQMNKEKRQFVYDYAPFYRLDASFVDREPNRSVMISNKKIMSKRPEFLLSEVMKDPGKMKLLEEKIREQEEKVLKEQEKQQRLKEQQQEEYDQSQDDEDQNDQESDHYDSEEYEYDNDQEKEIQGNNEQEEERTHTEEGTQKESSGSVPKTVANPPLENAEQKDEGKQPQTRTKRWSEEVEEEEDSLVMEMDDNDLNLNYYLDKVPKKHQKFAKTTVDVVPNVPQSSWQLPGNPNE